jgi:hypothetical protein
MLATALTLMAVSPECATWGAGTLVRADSQSTAGAKGGIRTDRLSPRQLRVWKRIERVVHVHDSKGQALHPTLGMLWRKADSCGHDIFIELGKRGPGNVGGKFTIEKLDTDGKRHSLSIRVYLVSIDEASTSEGAQRSDGFIPFERGANQLRMRRLEFLARVIEEPANAMEKKIWRELLKHASRKSGDSLR